MNIALKKRKIFLAITLLLIALLCVFAYFVEPLSYCRLFLSVYAFGVRCFEIGLNVLKIKYNPYYLFPNLSFSSLSGETSLGGFWFDTSIFFKLFGSNVEWLKFCSSFTLFLTRVFQFALILSFLFIVFNLWNRSYFVDSNKSYRERSKAVDSFNYFYDVILKKIKGYIVQYWHYLRKSPFFLLIVICLSVWLWVLPNALDLISFYFYFFFSFDWVGLIDLFLCLISSFFSAFKFLPLWAWFVVAYLVFRKITNDAADSRCENLINHDKEVVSSDTGVFTLVLGKMRGGKTSLIQSMSRYASCNYRENCFDNMKKINAMFPDFPFIALEKFIANAFFSHKIVNCEQSALLVYNRLETSKKYPKALFGYDLQRQRSSFYDGSVVFTLTDCLLIYAESYFIYFAPSSLIASNFAIREDDLRLDQGHLVLWDCDYFNHDYRNIPFNYSHVVRYDALRFGRKIHQKSPWNTCNGPMVVCLTEFGKERGNSLTNIGVSSGDDSTNVKNDMLDYSLKLGGHIANIWHSNLFKVITDEQRSGSLSANLVDVAQTILTADPKNREDKLALSFYWLEPTILDFILKHTSNFITKYRFVREDTCLLSYFIFHLNAWAYKKETYVINRWGYQDLKLPSCSSSSSGDLTSGDDVRYFLLNKVDFSNRFESACMKDFLNKDKLKATAGVFDLPNYSSLMPSKAEWDFQGSFMVNDMEHPLKSARIGKKKNKAS